MHLIDAGSVDPVEDWNIVESELKAYGHGLVDRPRFLVLNKRELLDKVQEQEITKLLENASGRKLILISAAMSKGLDVLMDHIWKKLEN